MDHDVFYQAMLARDYRFDGKFFIGVKTTGIYCRPICPAKPKRENVEFFLSSRAAERSGYRPCLRCRPESAPLSPAWFGKSAVVNRALKVISNDGFFESNEDRFADQFGVTARHLRRLFIKEIGQTPKQIAYVNRLNFARKLIVESNLPFTSVASTAGFSSLRRFNDAFKKRFQRAPRELRKKKEINQDAVELTLSYRPPFDWQSILSFYRSHQIIGVENVTDHFYERIFRIGKSIGSFQISQVIGKSHLLLRVTTEDPKVLFSVVQKVRRMFDLDSDPLLVANSFQTHQVMQPLWRRYPGLRVASGWDPFETSIGTILGQLVSVSQARSLVHQLVTHYGEKVTHPITGREGILFPSAEILAEASLKEVKTTEKRRKTIRNFAKQVLTKEVDLITPQDPTQLKKRLMSISGIGPWSAEYICLRALGDSDSFPGTDLVLKRAVKSHSNMSLESVRPWRSYAAVYLWKHHAEQQSKRKELSK